MLCFVVVMQSFIMNSHEVFIHIYQGCFAGNGAIVRLPQCQWSKPDGYGKISQCITPTKHSKVKTVCIFLGIYCIPLTVTGGTAMCSVPVVIEVHFIQNPHIRHHIARPVGIHILSQSNQMLIIVCYTGPCYNGTPLHIFNQYITKLL